MSEWGGDDDGGSNKARPSTVGVEWRGGGRDGNGTEKGVDRRKKLITEITFSSFGGLDWDLERMFPAPPLPEEKSSPSGWRRWA